MHSSLFFPVILTGFYWSLGGKPMLLFFPSIPSIYDLLALNWSWEAWVS